VAKSIYNHVRAAVKEALNKSKELEEAVSRLKPCPLCVTKHFVEYVVLEAVKLAASLALEEPDIKASLARLEEKIDKNSRGSSKY
jgi:hypothetical protein